MANTLTNAFKQAILSAWLSGKTIKAVLVDDGTYTYSSSHGNLSDIPSGARVATSGALTSITSTNGVFDTADFSFTGVSGATVERLVVYYDSGTEATSTLIAHYDTATGLVLTPNGGNVDVTVNASGWFAL